MLILDKISASKKNKKKNVIKKLKNRENKKFILVLVFFLVYKKLFKLTLFEIS